MKNSPPKNAAGKAGSAKPNADVSPELETLKAQLEQAEAAKMRALADLENYRRREAEQRSQWGNMAVADFLRKFLPNFRELSLGAEHSSDESVKKVIGKFFQATEKIGIQPISPEPGTTLNPDEQEVLMTAEGTPGTVVQTLESGWKYGETVLVPAKISAAPQN